MGWLIQEDLEFTELLGLRPELQAKFQAFLSAVHATESVPQEVLQACRIRIEEIHGLSRAKESETPSDGMQAALLVAERIPYQHHQVTDDEVGTLKRHFGEDGTVTLLTALAFYDVLTRLKLTLNERTQ